MNAAISRQDRFFYSEMFSSESCETGPAKKGRRVVAVSGLKNSGKTTLLAGLIPALKERGLTVAAIKHDGHDFEPDVPGADSFRLRLAGAEAVAVYSSRRFMITAEREGLSLADMIAKMPDTDLILVEGAKCSPHPKIEILRAAAGAGPVCDPATLLALATDTDLKIPGVPAVLPDAYQALAGLIVDYFRELKDYSSVLPE